MISTIAALLLALQPYSPVIETSVTTYELNHYYDDAGQLVFTQRIFYDDDNVLAWRMERRPAIRLRDRSYAFVEGVDGAIGLRRIRCQSVMETWTLYDVELKAREKLPQEFRRGLGNIP